MVLNKNKVEKVYDNVNLFNNDCFIRVSRMDDASALFIKNNKNTGDNIYWSKYQIKETDMRTKTATFTSDINLDLTTGLYVVLIGSSIHENFAGFILKKDYNEDSGLYNYTCQDYSRKYNGKFELVSSTANVYRILQCLITREGIPVNGKITSKQLKNFKNTLSGLRPVNLYDPEIWGNDKTSNPMNLRKNIIIRDTTYMKAIRNLVFGSGAYIDVYFTDNGVLQIEPFNKYDWWGGGLVIGSDEAISRNFTFDTTNAVTSVLVNGDGFNIGSGFTSTDLTGLKLSAFFGSLVTSISNPIKTDSSTTSSKTNNSTSKSNKTSNKKKKEGTGITVHINTDNIKSKSKDKQMLKDIAKLLQKRGYKTTIGAVSPNAHYSEINKVKKNGIYFTMYGGRCAGTLKEQCYSNHYHNVLKKKNAKMVVGFLGKKLTDDYLPRAHDDNFSPSSFKGWSKPRTHLLNNGIGIAQGNTVKEIVASFPGFKKSSNSSSKSKTKSNNNTKTNTVSNNDLSNVNLLKAKACEELSKSLRDYLKLKIKLPLGNPLFNNIHTNMFLWTVLPEEFSLVNFSEISKALNSAKIRFGGYEADRWYIEEVTINNDGKTASMELTVNPFASDLINYRDARLKFESDYKSALSSQESSSNSSNNGKSKQSKNKTKSKKQSIKEAIKEVGKLMEKKRYARHTYTKYSEIKKYGKGDCWAGSYFIACELKKRGVTCKIVQYSTLHLGPAGSSRHRSVMYKNDKGKWVDFPYRDFKIDSSFRNLSNKGKTTQIKIDCS